MAIVFISGASSGFGRACAQKFAAEGYDIILNARREDRLAELAAALTTSQNIRVLILPFDVSDRAETASALAGMPGAWRDVDILINNAGLAAGRDAFQDADIDDWERMIDTNVKGLLYVTHFICREMIRRRSGHIINISSIAGKEVYPQGNVYCASKHAVTALSQGMRMDLLPYGIRVTNISPGLAETEFSIVRFKGDRAKAASVYQGFDPLKPEDIADVAWFAASRPPHVNLEEITILPTAQSDSRTVFRKEG